MKTKIKLADILIDSLSYIKNFHQKVVVIKYGGHAMLTPEMREKVIRDIVLLKYIGMKPVIVHGGGPEINELLKVKEIKSEFVNGLRVTTPEIMENVEMVLTGSVSPNLASLFNAEDISAVSISGKDNRLIQAKIKDESLGLVGEVEKVNVDYLNYLLDGDLLPIISPIAYGPNGVSLNLNSDDAASYISQALGAEKLILLTDIDGVMEDPSDSNTLIKRMNLNDIEEAIDKGIIQGGMIPKINCCAQAVQNGVKRCHIINGMIDHALIVELFTKTGIGTMIEADNTLDD